MSIAASIPPSELAALQAVILRLEEVPPMPALERWRKRQARRLDLRPDVREPEDMVRKRLERTRAKTVLQPRDRNHTVYGDTEHSIGFHARHLDSLIDDWFAWAHLVPPHSASRILVILKRAKLPELRSRFEAAYNKHFADHFKVYPPPAPTGDPMIDLAQERVPALTVKFKGTGQDSAGKDTWAFEFHCRECGGYIVSAPDGEDDDGPAICAACGEVFGSMRDVKSLCRAIARGATT